ncbi:hypothetical protein HDU83_009937 [Entophlyctis luteolus]|nr:hypothetical protein HDU83_009937 [Entophlyctis luteolus]KAJ3392271.1 hypothetical protein HDU84_004536 [Entophlyctis sp. JEL0112]
MSPNLDFDTAAAVVAANAAVIDSATLLQLYALFKVATVGPCRAPQPSVFSLDFSARAKWAAWRDLGDSLSSEEAQQKYADIVGRLVTDGMIEFSEGRASAETIESEGSTASTITGSSTEFGFSVSMMAREESVVDNVSINLSEATLFEVVQRGDLESVRDWLRNGSNASRINECRKDDGATALHWAADRNLIEIVKLLLTYPVNMNCQDLAGMTPLHYAKLNGNEEIYDILLQAGADASIADDSGCLAEDL